MLIAVQGDVEEARRLGLFEWVHREIPRISTQARGEQAARSWTIAQFWSGKPVDQVPEGIQRKTVTEVLTELQRDPGVETLWEVRHVGAELRLRPWTPKSPDARAAPIETGSPLAWIRARRRQFVLSKQDASGKVTDYVILPRESPEFRCRIERPGRIRISSDLCEVDLATMLRPAWARRFGRDQFGLYAEFELKGVVFHFHWIPARNGQQAQADLNANLRTLRVLSVEKHFCPLAPDPGWAVCVEYLEAGAGDMAAGVAGAKRVDYREVLDPETFAIFAALRRLRKEIATQEGVPIYTIMTNEQLASVARKRFASGPRIEIRHPAVAHQPWHAVLGISDSARLDFAGTSRSPPVSHASGRLRTCLRQRNKGSSGTSTTSHSYGSAH
jgi:hypothetical protein